MTASAEPVHKGTLVCVVLKARNLPNKKSIGKQDPYTVLSMGQEQQKTKPDKRGGQHPTWDEQLHFEVYEDMEDALTTGSTTGSGSGSKATSPAITKPNGGKKVLKVACYADDSKEPEFIGEGLVDLTETLKTGEFDEWVTIKAKDRYAGEVYLELTFYSSAKPPKKRRPSTQPVLSGSDTYGGAGSFSRIEDGSASPPKPAKGKPDHPPIPSSMRPGGSTAGSNAHNRMSSSISTSGLTTLHRPPSAMSHSQTMHDLGSSTLRPSSSLANLDAYTPAYAPASISRSTSPVPPSSSYHNIPAAGGSRRNSFVTTMPAGASRRESVAGVPSEFGQSITPSASYYSQHSMTPSQSSQYVAHSHAVEPSDDRYATVRPATISQAHHQQYNMPRSQSTSHIPIAYNHMPQPDFGADQLTQSMSKMGFGHSAATIDKPLPPRSPLQAEERPPQSHIYQAPAHLASLYTPPPNAGYSQDVQRPVSPAARPPSAPSQYSTSPSPHVNPPPSVVNAQAYYQQQQQPPPPSAPQAGGHLAHPPTIPPRSSSPGVSPGYTPIPSPYSQPAQQQAHVSRPLPSTQSSASLSSAASAQPQPQAYSSHLYQPVQQPSPPPPQPQQLPHSHSHSHSLSMSHCHSHSQSTWQGPPPVSQPAQPSYAPAPASHPTSNGMASSMSSGYLYSPPPPSSAGSGDPPPNWVPGRSPSPLPPIPGSQHQQQPPPPPPTQPSQHMPTSGSMHSFYPPDSPAPVAHGYPQGYSQYSAPPSQHQYTPSQAPPNGYPYSQQPLPPPQQPQQHYATVSAATHPAYQPSGGLPSSFSSSALYQSHQNHQYAQQQQQPSRYQ